MRNSSADLAEKFPARERGRAQILLQMKDIEKKFNAEKFDELTDYYDLDDPRFSVFQDFPPATLMHKEDVLLTAKKASHELERVSVRFKDINVDFFHGNIALVTYTYR